jgi:hypothetical protein
MKFCEDRAHGANALCQFIIMSQMCLREPRRFAFKTHIYRNFIIFGFENDKLVWIFR